MLSLGVLQDASIVNWDEGSAEHGWDESNPAESEQVRNKFLGLLHKSNSLILFRHFSNKFLYAKNIF